MGCGASTVDAPEVVIPDPGVDEECIFGLKKGGGSGDYIAYKGEDTSDNANRWLVLNKTGEWFSDDGTLDLENFTRGTNPDKPKQGQVLWSAAFTSPDVERFYKSPTNEYQRYASNFGMGDPEIAADDKYFQGYDMRDGGYRRVMKWRMKTQAKVLPGASGLRGSQYPHGFALNVFAVGTSAADYDWNEPERDGDGQVTRDAGWSHRVREFVDHLEFQVVNNGSGQVIAAWLVQGDVPWINKDADAQQDNPIFTLDLIGGWFSSKMVVKTKPYWDPTFALALTYLCAVEYSPSGVKGSVKSDFPDDPMMWGGGGW